MADRIAPVTIYPQFKLTDIVYLKTDLDQKPRIVISYIVFEDGDISYSLVSALTESRHFGFEISTEITVF